MVIPSTNRTIRHNDNPVALVRFRSGTCSAYSPAFDEPATCIRYQPGMSACPDCSPLEAIAIDRGHAAAVVLDAEYGIRDAVLCFDLHVGSNSGQADGLALVRPAALSAGRIPVQPRPSRA